MFLKLIFMSILKNIYLSHIPYNVTFENSIMINQFKVEKEVAMLILCRCSLGHVERLLLILEDLLVTLAISKSWEYYQIWSPFDCSSSSLSPSHPFEKLLF